MLLRILVDVPWMSVVALALGALTVASAVYLILDLSSPYSGVFRASPGPLQQLLEYMGQGQETVARSASRSSLLTSIGRLNGAFGISA